MISLPQAKKKKRNSAREGEIKRQREKKSFNEASSGRDRGAVKTIESSRSFGDSDRRKTRKRE